MKEQYYRHQQQKLAQSGLFRQFWLFWSIYSIFLLMPMALLLYTRNGRAELLLCVAAFGFSRGILCNIVAQLYHRQRPYQRYNFEPRTSRWFSRRTEKLNSFPSKHVASLTSIGVMLMFFHPISGAVILGVSVMAGWARVVVGYHYATDVAAGVAIGIIGAIFIYYFGYSLLFTVGR